MRITDLYPRDLWRHTVRRWRHHLEPEATWSRVRCYCCFYWCRRSRYVMSGDARTGKLIPA